MAKVTSKLQVTIPKRIADAYGIAPGDEIDWIEAGEGIRVVAAMKRDGDDRERRLDRFDRATERQAAREESGRRHGERDWTREDLYARGSAR